MATQIALCRHGETDWNTTGRYQGQSDVPLNEAGIRQAEALAAFLQAEPIAAIYTSKLQRAAVTADIIAVPHRVAPRRDERLNEINQGEWEGLTYAEINSRFAPLHDRWLSDPLSTRPPAGESIQEVQTRVLEALEEILAAHAGSLIAIVAHKVSLTVIRCALTGDSLVQSLNEMPPNGWCAKFSVPKDMARQVVDRA